jgi:nitrogen fixation NifU-like protein
MSKAFYLSQNLLKYYQNPKNVGSFIKDSNVGTGIVGSPACGDVMKLQIKVNEHTKVIEDACFKTFGCGSAIASSEFAAESVKYTHIDNVVLSNIDIAKHLQLPPVKLHCSMLAEDAIRSAIRDYKQKQKEPK